MLVHPDSGSLARAAAAALAGRSLASVVLTGGGIGTLVLAELAGLGPDWRETDVWWGDERFLPAGDPDRNETGARAALLDHIRVSPARVHPMPASDGPDGDDAAAAAARYARELGVPAFDVLLLGIGPEGHVASLFPGRPAAAETERTVVAVRDSPKPPPVRLSLTWPALTAAREVWIVAAGPDKADAVGQALAGRPRQEVPAAGARGRDGTVFWLDAAAAAHLPG